MTDWLRGYTAGWEVYSVDRNTWADSERIDDVLSVSVTKSGGSGTKMEEGTMEVIADTLSPMWCRIYMTAEQDSVDRYAIATLLFESTSSTFSHNVRTITAAGRSVLQPAADIRMSRGSFAAKGTDGAAEAARLIRSCTPAPVYAHGSFKLGEDVVFDIGCTYLDAAWQLIDAGGWCIQIDGNGEIHIMEKPSQPALELSHANVGLLLPGIDCDYDLSDVPNRYIAVSDDEIAIATNTDKNSATGFPARQRWIDFLDESPVTIDGEPLERYAERKLAEKSTSVTRKYRYQREYVPDVMVNSLVKATIAENGIEGNLRVLEQSLRCDAGVIVTETAGEEELV